MSYTRFHTAFLVIQKAFESLESPRLTLTIDDASKIFIVHRKYSLIKIHKPPEIKTSHLNKSINQKLNAKPKHLTKLGMSTVEKAKNWHHSRS